MNFFYLLVSFLVISGASKMKKSKKQSKFLKKLNEFTLNIFENMLNFFVNKINPNISNLFKFINKSIGGDIKDCYSVNGDKEETENKEQVITSENSIITEKHSNKHKKQKKCKGKNFWDIRLKEKYGELIINKSDYEIDNGIVFLFFDFVMKCNGDNHFKIPINLPVTITNGNVYSSSITYEMYACNELSESSSSASEFNNVLYINGKIEAKQGIINFYNTPFEKNILYVVKGQMNYKYN